MGSIDNPPAGVTLKYVITTVFGAANMPAAFTDLNLSAFIGGAKRTLVCLAYRVNGANPIVMLVRTNGDTHTRTIGDYNGVRSCKPTGTSTYTEYVIVMTDDLGIIEHMGNPQESTTIRLLWWINL